MRSAYEAMLARFEELKAKADTLSADGKVTEAAAARREAASLSSPPVTIEMSFNVYRTTKGKIGEPVYAEMEAVNPLTHAQIRSRRFPHQGILQQPSDSARVDSIGL